MKKAVVLLLSLAILILFSIIGYVVVSANTEVETEENLIDIQNQKKDYLKSYGYTIDNPNIILNPFDISPLTALILFETETYEEVTITIEGKTPETTYTNKFEKSKIHYIPVYGLYADTTNKVQIKCGSTTKTVEIKTDKLPKELTNLETTNHQSLLFTTSENFPYAIDENNDIRWYLTKKYKGIISQLSNGHFLLSTDKQTDNKTSTGFIEIDLLGKIAKEYNISTGYLGSYVELENSFLILSNNLLEIDKQSGTVIDEIKLTNNYYAIEYKDKIVTLYGEEETRTINLETKEQTPSSPKENQITPTTQIEFYNTTKNYTIETGISLQASQTTATSNQTIFLLNYKNPDKNYEQYNISLKKETNRLVVSGEFSTDDEVTIILEKFLDKKVYKVEIQESTTYKYINQEGLNGKYSIYIKINDNLYKTNHYVTF